MSILLCHIAFSYFTTLFVVPYFALFVKKRTIIIITPYILLFTLVFHYADVTLCMTLSARILILVALRNCVCITISGREHRDYKRIEAAPGDELWDKLNKSNGGANLSPRCISMKTYSFCQFLLVFMTSMHTDTDYTRKTCF